MYQKGKPLLPTLTKRWNTFVMQTNRNKIHKKCPQSYQASMQPHYSPKDDETDINNSETTCKNNYTAM